MLIEQDPSPNHNERDPAKPVDVLMLHYTGMESGEGAVRWLCNPASQVSSHYVVHEDGRIVQLVDEARRAWHAGRGSWFEETDLNTRSIGIEIVNPGHNFGYRPFPDAQVEAVIALSRAILGRHPIPPERVLAHSDTAPMRKEDPGELFPWQRLHAAGIGHCVAPSPIVPGPFLQIGDHGAGVGALKQNLRRYGYGVGEDSQFDVVTDAVVTAFQRHFRPEKVDGIADASTVATLIRLLAALPARP